MENKILTYDSVEISFDGDQVFDRLLLQENITEGQRIEQFVLECLVGDSWIPVTEGTTIGYKRILRFDLVRCSKARIVVRESRDVPQMSEIGFYKADDISFSNSLFSWSTHFLIRSSVLSGWFSISSANPMNIPFFNAWDWLKLYPSADVYPIRIAPRLTNASAR